MKTPSDSAQYVQCVGTGTRLGSAWLNRGSCQPPICPECRAGTWHPLPRCLSLLCFLTHPGFDFSAWRGRRRSFDFPRQDEMLVEGPSSKATVQLIHVSLAVPTSRHWAEKVDEARMAGPCGVWAHLWWCLMSWEWHPCFADVQAAAGERSWGRLRWWSWASALRGGVHLR